MTRNEDPGTASTGVSGRVDEAATRRPGKAEPPTAQNTTECQKAIKVKKKPTGKLTKPNVPHRSWTCIDVYDVEKFNPRLRDRFVHPDYHETFDVGCICSTTSP
jgi:hypothetical protein